MLLNKLPNWWSFDGWICTSVMSLGGNLSELLGGGNVSFGLGSHGGGERNNNSTIWGINSRSLFILLELKYVMICITQVIYRIVREVEPWEFEPCLGTLCSAMKVPT